MPPTATPDPPVEEPPCEPTLAPRTWRLTHVQLENTLNDVFGYAGTIIDNLPREYKVVADAFSNHPDSLVVTDVLADDYLRVALEVGEYVAEHAADFIDCPIIELDGGVCLDRFIQDYGLKAWRRPLSGEEALTLAERFESAAEMEGSFAGLREVVSALITSPNLLFRSELGAGPTPDGLVELTSYERASLLSYTLWDAPPDGELLELAASGALGEEDVFAMQAERLLRSEKARGAWNRFVSQWLDIDQLLYASKSEEYAEFTPELVSDLVLENERFVSDVAFGAAADRSLRSLLSARTAYAGPRSGPLYGLVASPAEVGLVVLDPAERIGIFTQLAWLSSSPGQTTNPVFRGLAVYQTLLCGELPEPGPDAPIDVPPSLPEDATVRERLELHRSNPECAKCHDVIDSLGIALENYDAIGRYRTVEEHGKPIDASGSIELPSGAVVSFLDFVDLIEQLVELPEVYDCFSRQYLSYTSGRAKNQLPACERNKIAAAFRDAGYALDALMLAAVTSPSLVVRKP